MTKRGRRAKSNRSIRRGFDPRTKYVRVVQGSSITRAWGKYTHLIDGMHVFEHISWNSARAEKDRDDGRGKIMTVEEYRKGGIKSSAPRKVDGGESGNVDELLEQLQNATDKAEKRKLRAQLRKLGHQGGLKR